MHTSCYSISDLLCVKLQLFVWLLVYYYDILALYLKLYKLAIEKDHCHTSFLKLKHILCVRERERERTREREREREKNIYMLPYASFG